MADISRYLANIASAIYGRDVRGSIHDAIDIINQVAEKAIGAGTAFADGDAVPAGYFETSYYFNTATDDLLASDGSVWNIVDNIAGNGISSISGPTVDPNNPLVDIYTVHFTKAPDFTFYVTNAKSIVSITGPSTVGLIDTYTITYNDSSTDTFSVTNGKDGNTVLRGNEVTGQATSPTQFTLSVKCQTDDTYINTSGYVYQCTQGAEANQPSLWSYSFDMGGAGGGAQYLYELSDVDRSSTQTPTNGQIMQFDGAAGKWKAAYGGSGHTMNPTPSSTLTEEDVVDAFNDVSVDGLNNEVPSIFGIQRWTNVKTFRVKIPSSGVGHYGVGEWKDSIIGTPTKAQEQQWGWYYHEYFKMIGDLKTRNNGTDPCYDVDLKFKYDPESGEPITLGGYILDEDTGCLCIKFANYVINPSAAKIFVDVVLTRNDIQYVD